VARAQPEAAHQLGNVVFDSGGGEYVVTGSDITKAPERITAPALPSMADRTILGYRLMRDLYRGQPGKVIYAEIPSIRGHFACGASPGTAEYA
jgi:hypothetical protein